MGHSAQAIKNRYTLVKLPMNLLMSLMRKSENRIQGKIENGEVKSAILSGQMIKSYLLEKTKMKIEGFEDYIHRTFVGAKRFSIEGLDTLCRLLEDEVLCNDYQNRLKTEKSSNRNGTPWPFKCFNSCIK